MSDYDFPTEVINLPSEGKHYPPDSPLREGSIDIKYMTTKEEDILTSTNLLSKGVVLDKLMESLVVTPGVKAKDLISGDYMAAVIAARVLAYGKDYPVSIKCSECKTDNKLVIDLTSFETKEVSRLPNDDGMFEEVLPSGRKVKFKLLTTGQETELDKKAKSIEEKIKTPVGVSLRMLEIIQELDGVTDKGALKHEVDNMISRDARHIRQVYREVFPEMDTTVTYTCSNPMCEHSEEVTMPVTATFFWPDSEG